MTTQYVLPTEQLYLPVDYLCCKIGKQYTYCKLFFSRYFYSNSTQNESVALFFTPPLIWSYVKDKLEEQQRKENLTLEIIQSIHNTDKITARIFDMCG